MPIIITYLRVINVTLMPRTVNQTKINDIMKHESDHENILRTTQRNFTNYLIYILHYIRKKDNQLNLIPPIASFLILIKTQV